MTPNTAHSTWTWPRLLVILGGIALFTSGALVYDPIIDPVVLVLLGPGVILTAILAWRSKPWLQLAASLFIATPALIVLLAFGEMDSLVNPFQGGVSDYLAIVALVLALALAVPGGIAGYVQSRRGTAPVLLRAGPRTAWALYLAAAVSLSGGAVLATAAAVSSAPLPGGGFDVEADDTVNVVIADHTFPEELRVKAGVLTRLVVDNQDESHHTLSYERNGKVVHHLLPRGVTTSLLVLLKEEGSIRFWCEPHPDMEGTMIVGAA